MNEESNNETVEEPYREPVRGAVSGADEREVNEMSVISPMTLEELLLEIEESGAPIDFWCTHCDGGPSLQIAELDPFVYKLRCGGCGRAWGGKRCELRWNVTGFDGADEIYSEDTELDTDTLKSHMQDLAKQHVVRGDRNRPSLWQVSLNRGARRLSYVCGANPPLRGDRDRSGRLSGSRRIFRSW